MRAPAVWAALREWALRLWCTLRGRRADDDLRRELDSHLELAEEVLRQRGNSPREAARLAVCVLPVRRALAIDPATAIKTD